MSDSKHGSKSNLNESNMPLLSEEAAEKAGDTPEKEVMIEMTETEKVIFRTRRVPVRQLGEAQNHKYVCYFPSAFVMAGFKALNSCHPDFF
jgi:hypothetical protein